MLKVSIKDLDSKMENIIKDVKISRHTIDVKINCRLDRSNSESEDYLKKIIKELRLFKHLTQIRMISISKEIIGNKREIVYRLFFDTWVDEIFDKEISPSDLDDLLASKINNNKWYHKNGYLINETEGDKFSIPKHGDGIEAVFKGYKDDYYKIYINHDNKIYMHTNTWDKDFENIDDLVDYLNKNNFKLDGFEEH